MIKFDYHTHSNYSIDAKASMDAMIEQAINIGLEEYVITDHIDFGWPDGKIIGPYGVSEIVDAMQATKAKYEGRIKILLGLEISLRPDVADIARKMVAAYDFDFIVGSAHDIKGIDVGWAEFHQGRSKYEAYLAYFENLLDVVQICDAYDVIGHLDYVKRYGNYTDKSLYYTDFCEIIDEILKTIIAKGKGIEINTSGYAYGVGHPHPHIDILRRYLQLGGEIITVGSDAHKPDSVAQYFDEAHKILQSLDVKYIARFDKRKPILSLLEL